MDIRVREHRESDIKEMIRIWNEVVEEGIAFPQEELLTEKTGKTFFAEQSYAAVAVDDRSQIYGLSCETSL